MSDAPEAAMALAKAWDEAAAITSGNDNPWHAERDPSSMAFFMADRLELAYDAIERLHLAGFKLVRR